MGMTDSKEPSVKPEPPRPKRTTPRRSPTSPSPTAPCWACRRPRPFTGVSAKIIRAQVRNGLLKARMAGSTTMRIRRADLDAWLDALPAWHA